MTVLYTECHRRVTTPVGEVVRNVTVCRDMCAMRDNRSAISARFAFIVPNLIQYRET